MFLISHHFLSIIIATINLYFFSIELLLKCELKKKKKKKSKFYMRDLWQLNEPICQEIIA